VRAILTYHSIDESESPISVSPQVFREHVAWLSGSGVRVLPLAELVDLAPDDPRDAVAVTFDDGFANSDEALRSLRAHHLPATAFVVTGQVGKSNAWGGCDAPGIPRLPLLGWQGLEALAAAGVAIGAHTHTHPRLTGLFGADLEDELDRCAAILRERLGVERPYLAYPYGDVDERVRQAAAERYAGAVTTEFAPLASGAQTTLLPRLDMYYFRRSGAMARWGTPRFGTWLRSVRLRRTLRRMVRA
jgi:peptidoglycan/xylan/chitin deacetylase (PgdA/CDA1 family)